MRRWSLRPSPGKRLRAYLRELIEPRIAEYWDRVVKVQALRADLAGHEQSERQRNHQESTHHCKYALRTAPFLPVGNKITHRHARVAWIRSRLPSRRQGERYDWRIYLLALPGDV